MTISSEKLMSSEVKQVLRMKEGTSETSYANTSYIQKQVMLLTKVIKDEALRELYLKQRPTTLCIADLGCSSAEQTTFYVIAELIGTAEKARKEHGLDAPQDYQVFLNDLPKNDFNTLFGSVTTFTDDLKLRLGQGLGNCFVNGVPGSFYGRLFPNESLHFVHSSYSLMWLSKEPEGIQDNKRNIYIARTSPSNVCRAYYEQFQRDFLTFLHCRSKEVVTGGRMVLTTLGRDNSDSYCKESSYMWEILATALNDMVDEGYIEEDKVETFNLPQYPPSPAELDFLVKKEGTFTLNRVHVSKVNWEAICDSKPTSSMTSDLAYDFGKCMRSVAEPLLINHFGEGIVDEVFKRYYEIVRVSMAKEKNVFINVTISLTRN